jgi:hypothetical protein
MPFHEVNRRGPPVEWDFLPGEKASPSLRRSPGVLSRIASILIKGQALGTPSMVNATDHFGFVAQQIGSFKVGGTKFPLTAGAGNDTAGFVVGATSDLRVLEVAAP